MKAIKLLALCLILTLGSTSAARAVLVTFEWDTISFGSTLAGVANGDVITLNVFADNGGSSLANQTWNNADIQFGTLTVGSYMATYVPPTGFGDPVFQTDGAGVVSNARLVFFLFNPAHFDTLGGPINFHLARNVATTSIPNQSIFWAFPNSDTFNAAQWTLGFTPSPGPGPIPAPEPATLILFGIGLAGIGFAARRRRQAG